ncbi:EAL domain-containing protein [Sphingomonas parapaucimobilis]|uniref:bifunctional diguanylate cyclase/phosphodiesterase n=1 Tax=Sphingomonas parapaucimobilis TaxID=28213 RepID=UPI00391BC171
MRFLTCLAYDHDLGLVVLAAIFCLTGSAVTIRLLQRLRSADPGTFLAWVFMGGVSTGATIWCTHFIAMMAYQPGVAVAYDPPLTALSLVIAIFGSSVALAVAARRRRFAPAAGGMLFGLAVTAMHYTGMMAFAARGLVEWSPAYVAASILFSILFGALAFSRALSGDERGNPWPATALMVTSIVLLHFTGMAALTVIPVAPDLGQADSQSATMIMAFAVAAVGLLVLGTGFATSVLDTSAHIASQRRLAQVMEGSVDAMIVESDGVIVAANGAFTDLLGTDDNVLGQSLHRWVSDIGSVRPGSLAQRTLQAVDGTPIPVEIALRVDTSETKSHMIYALRDVRQRLAQERRIAHLARNDGLTGLPNRASFLEWSHRQAAPEGPGRPLALLSIDLDRFKEVNDTHGHAAGDHLLATIGMRMKALTRPGEFLARLGGDEFVALIGIDNHEDAIDLIDRLRTAITLPVEYDRSTLSCGMSVGVALWPQDADEISALINNADLAMYRAKSSIATDFCFYEEEMDKTVRTRRRIATELRDALDHDQFAIHWQVQASVETGDITGYEALLRWTKPDGTNVSPFEFIAIAEQTGLILPIGEWVLRRACREAATWPTPWKIAVNLSPVQLGHVDLPRLVHQILIETGLAPTRLELEITESAMITDPERTTHVLRQLKSLGVSIAMDDFGTGYSSLSTLRSFPFDKIKLDRSFMTELDIAPQSAAIIRAVLALGESLSIPILAEGVETPSQLEFLRAEGCNEAQGYLLGRPGLMTPDHGVGAPRSTRHAA